nr:NAD(P)H-dependent oxidoreductase [Streptomyces sp. NRRL S-87]
MKLVVVSAGLSSPSSTRLLADRLTAAALAHVDAEPEVIELRDLATEIAQHFVTGFPPARLAAALDAVAAADGLIAVTPVFAASYSGLFKSFFDLIDKAEDGIRDSSTSRGLGDVYKRQTHPHPATPDVDTAAAIAPRSLTGAITSLHATTAATLIPFEQRLAALRAD